MAAGGSYGGRAFSKEPAVATRSPTRLLKTLAFALGIATAAVCSAAGGNLVVNGSFDDGLAGWSTLGAVEASTAAGSFGSPPVAVFGAHGQPAGGRIEQMLATKPDGWYVVTFNYWAWGSGQSMLQLRLDVDGNGHLGSAGVPAIVAFNHYSLIFRADSEATRLRFTDITYTADDGRNLDLVLDNVSVVESVPEPRAVLLMGLGLGIVAWRARLPSRRVG